MEDKKVQMIYTYLVNYIEDRKIKELVEYLRDYLNGSFVDYGKLNQYLEDLDEFLNNVEV